METRKFTNLMWSEIEPLYKELVEHPFVVQLAKGTLSKVCFEHYLTQDILYIRDDAKALDIMSERATTEDERQFFAAMSADNITIEQALQTDYLQHFDMKEATQQSPAIKAYTDFLLASVKDDKYAVGAAALLPCFWVYHKVGKHVIEFSVGNNPYQKWIDTYSGDEFEVYVQQFIDIVEKTAKNATADTQTEMIDAFVQATEYELAFFNEAISIE
ncbi:MAG: TenA family protein [Hyphomicrobiales bacterium]